MRTYTAYYLHVLYAQHEARLHVQSKGLAVAANCLYALNRYALHAAERHKRLVYRLKNIFIEHLYTGGSTRWVKVHPVHLQAQILKCHSCEGGIHCGYRGRPERCYRCKGTGIYRTVRLYCFQFTITGRDGRVATYTWHQPAALVRFAVLAMPDPIPWENKQPRSMMRELDFVYGYEVLRRYLAERGLTNTLPLASWLGLLGALHRDGHRFLQWLDPRRRYNSLREVVVVRLRRAWYQIRRAFAPTLPAVLDDRESYAFEVPASVATCPYCDARLSAHVEGFAEDPSGYCRADDVRVECHAEPDIDSQEWDRFDRTHFDMPYVYWHPMTECVEDWINQRWRFRIDAAYSRNDNLPF